MHTPNATTHFTNLTFAYKHFHSQIWAMLNLRLLLIYYKGERFIRKSTVKSYAQHVVENKSITFLKAF